MSPRALLQRLQGIHAECWYSRHGNLQPRGWMQPFRLLPGSWASLSPAFLVPWPASKVPLNCKCVSSSCVAPAGLPRRECSPWLERGSPILALKEERDSLKTVLGIFCLQDNKLTNYSACTMYSKEKLFFTIFNNLHSWRHFSLFFRHSSNKEEETK